MFSTVRKLAALFDGRERWRALALFAGVVVMALVETVGIASIMPFMALVANPGLVGESEWLRWAFQVSGARSTSQFLFVAGVAVLAVIAFSNAFTALITWMMLRFVWAKSHRLSVRLLEHYLRQPYEFFVNRNTASLSRNILAEVMSVISGVMIPSMQLVARSLAALFIVGLLFLTDPLLTLVVVLTLGGAYAAIYTVVRRRQGVLGRERMLASGQRFTLAAEALGGIKDVKVLGREDSFLRRFSGPSARFSAANASNAIISQLPRYALETVAFGGILLIIVYQIGVRGTLDQVLPVVSLYAFAGYRLLPSLQQIFAALAAIRFNAPALDDVHADLSLPAGTPGPAASRVAARPARAANVELVGVRFRYPGADEEALRGVSLSIEANTTVGLIGPSGSGKTTVADLVLGLFRPSGGDILVDGEPLDPARAGWYRRVGYVPQQIFLCDDSFTGNIAFGVPEDEIDHAAVERAARVAHLHDFILTLPEGYGTVVGERGIRLSGGQRQRIGIARALYHDPDVLVLDEATSALDGMTEDAVMQAISELAHQKTIVLIAHRLTTVRECDRIFLLSAGTVTASGTYDELERESAQFRAMARITEPVGAAG